MYKIKIKNKILKCIIKLNNKVLGNNIYQIKKKNYVVYVL